MYETTLPDLGSYLKAQPTTGLWAINASTGVVTVTNYANATGETC